MDEVLRKKVIITYYDLLEGNMNKSEINLGDAKVSVIWVEKYKTINLVFEFGFIKVNIYEYYQTYKKSAEKNLKDLYNLYSEGDKKVIT